MYTVDKSTIHGYGLIATKDISKDTDIGLSHVGIGFVNERLVAGETSDIGHFQNHNLNPNCINKIVGENLHMVTMKKVRKDEELTIDFTKNFDICINIENSENWVEN
jgi:SET domain-containing protein